MCRGLQSRSRLILAALATIASSVQAQRTNRTVYLDSVGVVRWRDNRQEVTLFGANYVLPTASDYRAAGYLHADRKRMIDEDMVQFARMGWDGLRLTFWGDWEASDSAGNLMANDHLDLQDYLIAGARERGIYMLFSPIQLYGSNWPDALSDTSAPGFGRHFGKARMGTDPAALAAQVNYLRQILNHVNRYTGYMYPAMARTFRAVGAQFAAIFAYDMLQTASRNLGWQTHYLNLVYTPRKAMSAIIAAEAMRRLPRLRSYGPYPENARFGDFHVSYVGDLGELVARDALLYAGSAQAAPPDRGALRRIAGCGSSPVVSYEGEGIYFLDKVRPGVWRLEVYPDAVPVRDPFEPPSRDKLVTRAISRSWHMTVRLPDLGGGFTVQSAGGYLYAASVPGTALREGPYQFVVTLFRGDSSVTFPEGLHLKPTDWDYHGTASWQLDVVGPRTPLRLFEPGRDAARLAFTRIGDAGRRGLFRLTLSQVTGEPVFHFELPVDARSSSPPDYTASLVVKERIGARQETMSAADELHVRLRGLGARQILHVTLMEDDGTSWSAAVPVDSSWSERAVPLTDFTIGRGVLLPEGFPGEWNYWVRPAAGRGSSGDRPRLDRVERLQLSLRREDGVVVTPGGYGVEVESISLGFGHPPPAASAP